jgi:PKHD-type hydroxylase
MSFNKISNNPWEKHTITYPWVYWDGAFTEEELQTMIEYFDFHGVERAVTVGAMTVDSDGKEQIQTETNEKHRKSNVKFHQKTPDNAWIFDRINFVSEQINELFYGFDVYGFDAIQYTEYESEEKGRYDFHMDTILGPNVPYDMQTKGTRKLSLVLLLSEPGVDFEGGEFLLNNGKEEDAEVLPTKKGRIVAFPSWMIHKVAPTLSGKRKSLVTWILGPKFK